MTGDGRRVGAAHARCHAQGELRQLSVALTKLGGSRQGGICGILRVASPSPLPLFTTLPHPRGFYYLLWSRNHNSDPTPELLQ